MGILGRHATHFDFRLMGDQILLYNMPICKMVPSLHSPIPMPPPKHPFNPHWMLLSWQAVSNPPLPSRFLMLSLNHPCKSHRMCPSLQVVNSLFLLIINGYLPGTETCSQSLHCQQLSPSQPPHPHPSFHVLFCMYGIPLLRCSTGSASHAHITIALHTILTRSSLQRSCLSKTSLSL